MQSQPQQSVSWDSSTLKEAERRAVRVFAQRQFQVLKSRHPPEQIILLQVLCDHAQEAAQYAKAGELSAARGLLAAIAEVGLPEDAELQAVAHRIFMNGGMSINVVELAGRKAAREKTFQRVKDAMDEISAIGVQVKDLDIGLLDFPCKVDGQVVLLCWKLGEKSITHWHGVSEGFAGRKPVTSRIANAKRSH